MKEYWVVKSGDTYWCCGPVQWAEDRTLAYRFADRLAAMRMAANGVSVDARIVRVRHSLKEDKTVRISRAELEQYEWMFALYARTHRDGRPKVGESLTGRMFRMSCAGKS